MSSNRKDFSRIVDIYNIFKSLRGLKEENALKSPNEDFDCEEFRYSHRFAPFQFFQTPPVCMYHQYRATDAHFVKSVNVQKMYAFAQEHFEIARSIYEKHPEYQPVRLEIKKLLSQCVLIINNSI